MSNMVMVDSLTQTVAVIGVDEFGKQLCVCVCTHDEVQKASKVIFTAFPGKAVMVAIQDITWSDKPSIAKYIPEETERIQEMYNRRFESKAY